MSILLIRRRRMWMESKPDWGKEKPSWMLRTPFSRQKPTYNLSALVSNSFTIIPLSSHLIEDQLEFRGEGALGGEDAAHQVADDTPTPDTPDTPTDHLSTPDSSSPSPSPQSGTPIQSWVKTEKEALRTLWHWNTVTLYCVILLCDTRRLYQELNTCTCVTRETWEFVILHIYMYCHNWVNYSEPTAMYVNCVWVDWVKLFTGWVSQLLTCELGLNRTGTKNLCRDRISFFLCILFRK